jgi:hypothetical protein
MHGDDISSGKLRRQDQNDLFAGREDYTSAEPGSILSADSADIPYLIIGLERLGRMAFLARNSSRCEDARD